MSQIVTVAPCIIANPNDYWVNNLLDIPSVEMFYNNMTDFGIVNLFGPNWDDEFAAFCASSDMNGQIC